MLFAKSFSLTMFALNLGASQVYATPLQGRDDNLIVTYSVDLPEGTLTVWGEAPGSNNATGAIEPRDCGTNDVSCDGSHAPVSGSCAQLISALNQNGNIVLGDSPRAICLTQNGNQCCTSWSQVVHGMREASLISAAQKIEDTCVGPRGQSGLARNVGLEGVCLTQCLSDRASGCD